MTPYKLLFAVANFPPISGGISHHLHELVRHLPAQQVQVVALPTPNASAFDGKHGFGIDRLRISPRWGPNSPQFKLLAPFYFTRLLTAARPDIVLCGQAHHTLLLPAWLVCKLRGIPYGVFVYGLDLLNPQTRRFRRLFNALLCSAQIVIADSTAAANIAFELGVERGKIHVLNPSIDPAQLAKCDIAPEVVLHRHGLEGKQCLLTVGRLVERKGFDTVIKALPAVLANIPKAHYLIVGTGPQKASLMNLVAALGLEEHVTFAGFVPNEELAAYYQACDVFAMISRELSGTGDIEGFGIVFLEANFYGKPVVAGRSGGTSDAVKENRSGLLVNPNNVDEVANALIRLLEDKQLAAGLGEFGRARVLTDFTSSVTAQRLLSILEGNLVER